MTANFGPTNLWPVLWPCDVSTESPTITGVAVRAATNVLWAKTGMRFGTSQVKLRPCRRSCRGTTPWVGGNEWPGSIPLSGSWALIDAGCGSCVTECSCTSLSEILLPTPVNSIVEVRMDGAVVTGSSYRVDNNRSLIALGPLTWPYCQNLRLDDTQPGTFSVTALFGEDVPDGAAPLAVGELACQFIRAFNGEDCQLPSNLTSLARQGVSISLPDTNALLADQKMLGLRWCDLFISNWNPHHLIARSRAYSVDRALGHRRAGT